MPGQKTKSARTIAAIVLNQFDPKRNYAALILNKLLQQTNERQRATDLVLGTIRNRSAIDMVIAKFANCPTDRIPAKLLNIIRIAAYELFYNPQTSDYAIVNEAVNNAKPIASKKQTGFVNAVLRQITRHIKNRHVLLTEADAEKTLPQTSATGCEFDSNILPVPELSPVNYFSTAFSLPKWLITDWLAEFGLEKTRQICFAGNRKPSIYIRPNTLKTTAKKLIEKFLSTDIHCEMVPDGPMIKMTSASAVTELPGFTEGLFSVQDLTASQAVNLLKPQPGQAILDLCAAPGSKTIQLAQASGDKAKIIATDIDSQRLEMVKENTARLGLKSVNVVAYENLRKVVAETGPFDCILLDVPCSNTGVLAKRIEVRYRIEPRAITKLTKIQTELLTTAASMIKPKGRIAYSTCSIQKSENAQLIKDFLRKNTQLKLESEKLVLPSARDFDHDGGYVAIITSKK